MIINNKSAYRTLMFSDRNNSKEMVAIRGSSPDVFLVYPPDYMSETFLNIADSSCCSSIEVHAEDAEQAILAIQRDIENGTYRIVFNSAYQF